MAGFQIGFITPPSASTPTTTNTNKNVNINNNKYYQTETGELTTEPTSIADKIREKTIAISGRDDAISGRDDAVGGRDEAGNPRDPTENDRELGTFTESEALESAVKLRSGYNHGSVGNHRTVEDHGSVGNHRTVEDHGSVGNHRTVEDHGSVGNDRTVEDHGSVGNHRTVEHHGSDENHRTVVDHDNDGFGETGTYSEDESSGMQPLWLTDDEDDDDGYVDSVNHFSGHPSLTNHNRNDNGDGFQQKEKKKLPKIRTLDGTNESHKNHVVYVDNYDDSFEDSASSYDDDNEFSLGTSDADEPSIATADYRYQVNTADCSADCGRRCPYGYKVRTIYLFILLF